MKAMIFAAGLGTRLRPFTDNMPKALVPVNGRPLLEHIILKLKDAGFQEIIVNVHHFPDMIIGFLKTNDNFGMRIEISDEREMLLDTGGAIKKAAHFFDDGKPFLVHNVDILSNLDLKEVCCQQVADPGRLATLVVSQRDTYRYLLFDKQNYLCGWINEKTGETKPGTFPDLKIYNKLAYAGIQVISPAVFQLMAQQEDKFPIMDFYLQHCRTEKISAFIPDDLKMMDMGKTDLLTEGDLFAKQYML
ncbi:MAG TPA: nucleotidyltransferase family protein [Paludibacteraceae bacterium]|nr:nucleotidyltransferase family protein [Paludibacteraceae bacterium]HPT43774.1 nucleotidyltransferase family protein [Paludibacteraceae bacterium]